MARLQDGPARHDWPLPQSSQPRLLATSGALTRSAHTKAAVHIDALSGDIMGPCRRQENGHRGNILRLLPAPQRHDAADLVAGPLLVALAALLRLLARPRL